MLNDSAPVINTDVLEDEDPAQCHHADTSAFPESDSYCDTSQLRAQLHHNLSLWRCKLFFMPVQYVLEPGCTVVYVPMLEMIQKIFQHTDILDRIKETKSSEKGHYMSHQDGSYFQENNLLSSSELSLPLILYIDDLEIANPLGTSRKIHKLCSVYWVVADLPVKYRSALHVIQLAALSSVF